MPRYQIFGDLRGLCPTIDTHTLRTFLPRRVFGRSEAADLSSEAPIDLRFAVFGLRFEAFDLRSGAH